MLPKFISRFLRRRKRTQTEIDPDEILLEAQNPADFDRDRFEGRIERPLTRRSFYYVGLLLAAITLLLVGRAV